MDLETVCPQKSRLDLAMKMNNLLASPGFSSWLEGEPLDVKRMLPPPQGQAPHFHFLHFAPERRRTHVLRLPAAEPDPGLDAGAVWHDEPAALLYMDEIYGYLPPSAMPPSKKPMMTMLKQARAFGLGVLLATQNPVDLDYKALSNIGTWWLGRLQTERDKARVLDGLEGAAASNNKRIRPQEDGATPRRAGEPDLPHEQRQRRRPTVFHVRWVMSYLTVHLPAPDQEAHGSEARRDRRREGRGPGTRRGCTGSTRAETAASENAARGEGIFPSRRSGRPG